MKFCETETSFVFRQRQTMLGMEAIIRTRSLVHFLLNHIKSARILLLNAPNYICRSSLRHRSFCCIVYSTQCDQTRGNDLAVVFRNLVCFHPLSQRFGFESLALSKPHTLFSCCNGSWESRSKWDSQRLRVLWSRARVACVEAYSFDFEQQRLFEYVGEGTK